VQTKKEIRVIMALKHSRNPLASRRKVQTDFGDSNRVGEVVERAWMKMIDEDWRCQAEWMKMIVDDCGS
jgi:hypothetical protein